MASWNAGKGRIIYNIGVVIPKDLQGVLWSKSVSELDFEADRNYIIHQVLASGTLDNIKWLFGAYGYDKVRKVFIDHPAKSYTEKTLNLFESVLLGISGAVDRSNYVKTYPRVIR